MHEEFFWVFTYKIRVFEHTFTKQKIIFAHGNFFPRSMHNCSVKSVDFCRGQITF